MLPISDEQYKIQFAVMAIECAARQMGVEPWEMHERLDRMRLVDNYLLRGFDMLHTQSLAYVADTTIEALHSWEKKGGQT